MNNIYKTIEEFRRFVPVDVVALCKELDIELSYEDMSDNLSGQIEKKEDGSYKITVNKNDGLTRQRFTIAHEIGHYTLHRVLIGNGLTENRMYRSVHGKFNNTSISNFQETEANSFAAYLLMPDEKIDESIKEGLSSPEIAERFVVSKQAMDIKLSNRSSRTID